jgi:hypothetical protein
MKGEGMKIKSIVFWLLWAGNNLTLQTVSGEDLEPGLGSLFGDDADDLVLLCKMLDSTVPQTEQMQLPTTSWSVC